MERKNLLIKISLAIVAVLLISCAVWLFMPEKSVQAYDLQYFTKEELKNSVSYLNSIIHDGQCYRNWDPTDWCYQHSDCIMAQIEAFEVTGDMGFLNDAMQNLEHLYGFARDCEDHDRNWPEYSQANGDGIRDWRCLIQNEYDHLHVSRLMRNFAYYVNVVRNNSELPASHIQASQKYELLVKEHFGEMLYSWIEYDDGEKGFFGYARTDGTIKAQNHNRASAEYDILLYLYEWTGEPLYKEMYQKWVNYFRSAIQTEEYPGMGEYYTWHYYDRDPTDANNYDACSDPVGDKWVCDGKLEMGTYANYDLQPILHGFRLGIAWTKNDMKKLANTYLVASSIKGNIYFANQLIDGNATVIGIYGVPPRYNTWSNEFVQTSNAWAWTDLSMVSEKVFRKQEEIAKKEFDWQIGEGGNFNEDTYYSCVADTRIQDGEVPKCTTLEVTPSSLLETTVKLLKYAR